MRKATHEALNRYIASVFHKVATTVPRNCSSWVQVAQIELDGTAFDFGGVQVFSTFNIDILRAAI